MSQVDPDNSPRTTPGSHLFYVGVPKSSLPKDGLLSSETRRDREEAREGSNKVDDTGWEGKTREGWNERNDGVLRGDGRSKPRNESGKDDRYVGGRRES